MEADRLGPILRPLFKNIKTLFKEIVQGEVVLGFRKGPEGKAQDIKGILWNKSFGCRVNVEGITDKGLFLIIQRNGGIFLSAKLLVLPQNNIDELIKKNEVNESILDAQKEIFNMLVGKINDILREKVEKNIHLIMEENFIVENTSFLPEDQKYFSYTAAVKAVGPVQFSMALVISDELAGFILKHISPEEEKSDKKDNVEEEKEEEKQEDKFDIQIPILKDKKQENGFSIEQIMEDDFPVAQIGTSLWDALIKMKTYGMDYIVLVDGLKFIGLLSMADIRGGLSPFIEEPFKDYCREQDLATKSFNIEWFLEKEITPIPYDASFEEAISLYLEQESPYVPVCKRNYKIVGVVTYKKLIQFLFNLLQSGSGLIKNDPINASPDQAVANA